MVRRLRRFMPSPAMVVALTALVMSLGGSAYALVVTGKTIRNNSVTGFDIRQRSLTGNDIKRDKIGGGSVKESTLGVVPSALLAHGGARFAVVNGGGQAVRGRDISSAARTGVGRYQVIFQRRCAGVRLLRHDRRPERGGPAPEQPGQRRVTGLERERRGDPHREQQRRRGGQGVPPDRVLLDDRFQIRVPLGRARPSWAPHADEAGSP